MSSYVPNCLNPKKFLFSSSQADIGVYCKIKTSKVELLELQQRENIMKE